MKKQVYYRVKSEVSSGPEVKICDRCIRRGGAESALYEPKQNFEDGREKQKGIGKDKQIDITRGAMLCKQSTMKRRRRGEAHTAGCEAWGFF